MPDKTLQIEATLVSLQRQIDEMKANSIRLVDDMKDEIERVDDDVERKHRSNGEKISQLEAKTDRRANINYEKIHQLEVNQAKIIQAVQLGGYFVKGLWGICGAVGGALVTALLSRVL